MNETSQIYVGLCDEGVDVWRPIQAIPLGKNVYRIVDQPYDREIETWKFEPGDEVYCELIDAEKGQILAALKKVSGDG